MIDFEIGGEWEGLDGFGEEELERLVERAHRAVKRAAVYLEGEVKKTLTGTRTGRSYRVSRTGRIHIASAPGEPPAVLTGALRNSVGHTDPRREGDTVVSSVGPGVGATKENPAGGYAVRLEFGGTDSRGVTILPRPYMTPTAERARPVIEQMLETEMQRP